MFLLLLLYSNCEDWRIEALLSLRLCALLFFPPNWLTNWLCAYPVAVSMVTSLWIGERQDVIIPLFYKNTQKTKCVLTHPSKAFSLTRVFSVSLHFFKPCFLRMISAASAPIVSSMSSGSTSSNQRSSLQHVINLEILLPLVPDIDRNKYCIRTR